MSGLRIDNRNVANALVIDLYGDVSADGDTAIRSAYRTGVESGTGNVVLNLEHADYINTSGISVLITLAMSARKEGVKLAVAGASAHYRKVFDLVQFSSFVTMYDDESAALAGFA